MGLGHTKIGTPVKVYLSIDLDYWRRQRAPNTCTAFFQEVWKLGLPIYVAMYHHHLLPHINAQDCDTLVNVDYHSDLVDLDPGRILDFQEGTWGNFVDWRHRGTFIWRYPFPECLHIGAGYCHDTRNPFEDPTAARWQRTQKRRGLYGVPLQRVKAVGVCLSPNWLGRTDVLTEPLTQLRIGRWLADVYRADERGREPHSRQPKIVRVRL